MKYGLIVLMTLLLSSGCSLVNFEDDTARRAVAPDVVGYPLEVQKKAAEEVKSGLCPVLNEMTADFSTCRDQSRNLH